MNPASVLNVAFYHFASVGDCSSKRAPLADFLRKEGVRGTVLLSPEGINCFLAGSEQSVEASMSEIFRLTEIPAAKVAVKRSWSTKIPFRRTLVRLKKEIIPMGIDTVVPAVRSSPYVSPTTLKRWLDEGEEVLLIDTRNDYEIALGTFRGALRLGLKHFRDFARIAAGKRAVIEAQAKGKKIVTFCTGGIRCEKAATWMESEGFKDVSQLEGGVLGYFEQVGSAHWDGSCFVFDQRVALDPALRPTGHHLCFACREVLTDGDIVSPLYIEDQFCPHCHPSRKNRDL